VRIGLLAPVLALALVPAGCGGGDDGDKALPTANKGAAIAKESATEGGKAEEYDQTGGVLADSGFRPEKDGFSFQNYASGYENLSPAEVEHMFGPQVCASRQANECLLTPPAQAWMNATNNEIKDGGHCFGFSVTALMMFDKALNPQDYGAPATPQIALPGNIPVQRRIAESFMLQASAKMRAAFIGGTPNQILDALTAGLKNHPDTYTLGFYKRDGTAGHAVTPYAVQDKGGGQFALLMYDNNFPGVTRAMQFDRNKNTWTYEASPAPEIDPFTYEGDASTQTQMVIPTSPGIGLQPCPFCAQGLTATRASVPKPTGGNRTVKLREYERVSLTADSVNHAHLLLTDDQGRRTGYVGKKLVKEIPGVQVEPVLNNQNWRLKAEPTYYVPQGLKYSISLDGATLKAADTESVSVIGPGYSAVVSDIAIRPREKHAMTLRANGTQLAYRGAGKRVQSPDIELGFDRQGAADKSFTVAAHKLKGSSKLNASVKPASSAINLSGTDTKGANAVVGLTSIPRSGKETTRQQSVRIQAKPRCDFRKGRACKRSG